MRGHRRRANHAVVATALLWCRGVSTVDCCLGLRSRLDAIAKVVCLRACRCIDGTSDLSGIGGLVRK